MRRKTTFVGLLAGVCACAIAGAANAQTQGASAAAPAAPAADENAPTVSGPTPITTSPIPTASASPAQNPNANATGAPGPITTSPSPTPTTPGIRPAASAPDAAAKVRTTLGADAAPAAKPSSSDRQLSRNTRAALAQAFPSTPGENGAPATGGIGGLKVTSRNGKVTLRGTVGTQQEKEDAAAKAAAIAGGAANVDDRLIVK